MDDLVQGICAESQFSYSKIRPFLHRYLRLAYWLLCSVPYLVQKLFLPGSLLTQISMHRVSSSSLVMDFVSQDP